MYPYTPPGSTTPLSAGTGSNATCYDNSPNFLEDPQVISCTGVDVVYNNLGYDPDLDSLYYTWSYPWDATTFSANPSTNSVNFSSGYSYNNPLPSSGSSTGAQIDSETGEVTFNSAVVGSWATCVKIEEWRCGQLVGEIFRDIPIVTLGCTPPTGLCSSAFVDEEPGMYLTSDSSLMNPTVLTPVTNASGDTIYYYTEVYPGDTVRFKISSSDPYPNPNCSSQEIAFKGSGGNLSSASNYSNQNTCLFNPPCATLTSLNPGGVFKYPGINNVQFNWFIDCNHLFYQQYQCGALKSEYSFYFRMQDDQCPINRFTYKKVVVKIKNYMPELPDISNTCISQDANGVTFDWVANPDTGFNFDYYLINHIDAAGTLTTVDTIFDWATQTYTHANAFPNQVNSYTIQVAGGCGLVSEPTDTIQNVVVDLQAFPPPPNSSIAVLSWNPWWVGDTTTLYDVWVEAPMGSGNWDQLGTTNGFTWSDTVAYCGEWLTYQVRYHGTCESSTDSGYFSDKTPPSPVVFDSVTVAGGNLAAMSWAGSSDSDVVQYVIYRKDNSGFYQPVDSITAAAHASSMPWTYALSNAENESETYIITAVDSCGNQSSVGNTIPSSTIFLNLGVDPCDGYARIRWNQYRTWTGTQVLSYNLFADITDALGNTISGVLLKGGNTDTVFNHYGIINGYNYCYYVRAVDTTGTRTSTSNKVCNSSAVVQGSKVLYLGRASVNSQNGIDLYAYIDKDADVIDFHIQRADDEIGPYLTIGTVAKPALGPWEVKFIDFTGDPNSRRYYYRVASRDSCGALDTISNLATNILLDVEAIGNLSNRLTWTAYRDFDAGVEEYQIYRSIDGGSSFTFAGSTKDTAIMDDIKPFSTSKGKFCYYIKAVAKDGIIPWRDEFGEKFNARSNVACAVHKARLWVPSAFNPKSDVVENRVWKPQGVFAREDSYTLFIMNRWGEEVFRTNDLNEGWNGQVGGEYASLGVYTYYIKYRSIEDVPIEERGSFTLLY
jgi:gliding motility-associated-like protein